MKGIELLDFLSEFGWDKNSIARELFVPVENVFEWQKGTRVPDKYYDKLWWLVRHYERNYEE